MLHPPKPSALATLPPNKDATPASVTGAVIVHKTIHPNAAESTAHATATATAAVSLPTEDLPSDAAMSDATAAASSEQPDSIPSTNPQSNLVGADHITGPFAASTVGNSANVVGSDDGPQGKDLGVIGKVSGKLSDTGLLSGVPASAAALQGALDSSTHAARTEMGLPINVSWQGKARLDQAAGSGSQEGKKNDGQLAAQTGPVSLEGSLASMLQGKKRKVPEATGGFLAPRLMTSTSRDCWLYSPPLNFCCVIILEADLPCQNLWLHTLPLFLCHVVSAEANLPCPHIQDCWLLTPPLFLCRVNIPEASFHRNRGKMGCSAASLVLTWFSK